MDRFDEEGPSGLYDREREGRPKKMTEEVEEEIEPLLEGNPTEEGKTLRARQQTGLQNTSKESLASTFIPPPYPATE
jgi:transposase